MKNIEIQNTLNVVFNKVLNEFIHLGLHIVLQDMQEPASCGPCIYNSNLSCPILNKESLLCERVKFGYVMEFYWASARRLI